MTYKIRFVEDDTLLNYKETPKVKFEDFIEQRMQRTMQIVGATTKKIIRKEFKKLKLDLIRGILKKNG